MPPTGALVVAFGSPPPRDLLRDLSARGTRVFADALPTAGAVWQPLSGCLAAPDMDEALARLRQLNGLRHVDGALYAQVVRYHGYEPWWCHQQTAFDDYVRPFLRYLPLLYECVAAERVIIWNCPADLRRLLPLVPLRTRVQFRDINPQPVWRRRARQIGSTLFFHALTTLALARAALKSPSDIVFTFDAVNRDGRHPWIDGLYRSLARRGTSFLEVLWCPTGTQALRNWRKRRRAAVFCQAAAPRLLGEPLAPQPVTESVARDSLPEQFLHNLAVRALLPLCSHSTRAINRYERLLRRIRPRGAYFMDDYVHAFELLIACRRSGIPTVGVQHGQFSRYTVGLMGYGYTAAVEHSFDRYCVWGEHFKQLLARHSALIPRHSVVVAGSPRGAPPNVVRARAADCTVVLFVAESYEADVQQREVAPYVRALAAAGLDVRVKLHPTMTQPPFLIRDEATGRAAAVAEGRIEDHLMRAAIVVGSFSSVLFEAILHERPVVLFATSRYHDPHGLAEAGLAEIGTSPPQLVECVSAARLLPEEELRRRRELVWGKEPEDGGEIAVAEMAALQSQSARRQDARRE